MTYCGFKHVVRRNLGEVARSFAFVVLAFMGPFAQYVDAAPVVSEQLIKQLKLLPRLEQEAVARQYGIDLETLAGIDPVLESTESEIGMPGQRLEPLAEAIEKKATTEDDSAELLRYGAHLFDREVSTFAAVDNFPVPESYLMGPGDTLNITLYGKDQAQHVLQIDREGAITFPRLGSISLLGLSFREAKQMIERRIAKQMIGTDVIVSMGRLRSISVFLAGEVKTPGSYSISSLSTLTQALYVAGGITKVGSLRKIQVLRKGSIFNTFDVYDLMLKGKLDGDIRLRSGDVLFVPTIETLVSILGEVRRPGEYELLDKRGLMEVLEMAGGLLSRGYTRLVRVERYSPGRALPELINIDLTDDEKRNIKLQDGDVVTIDSVSDRQSNPVEFIGALERPGLYAWTEGARFSTYVTDIDADLLPNTDLKVGLIARRKNKKLEIEIISFVIEKAIRGKSGPDDPLILPFDKVFIFQIPITGEANRARFLVPVVQQLKNQATADVMSEVVGIGGAVREPGEYPLLKGGTAKSLIDLAGGLRDGAYVKSAEIRRIDYSDGNLATVNLINISLTDVTATGSQLKLQSRDFLRVNYIHDWNPSTSITVEGEVIFPGEYLVSPGEKLSSIIRRAGGLTKNGFAQGASFTRVSIRDAEKRQSDVLVNRIIRTQASQLITSETSETNLSLISSGDSGGQQSLLDTLAKIETQGRLVIDLVAIIDGDSSSDIEVQDEDVLLVPVKTNAVIVVGEVNRAGSFRYQEQLTYRDYIELAAGATARADKRMIYVIAANGMVKNVEDLNNRQRGRWLQRVGEESLLSAGDTIVVPIDQKYQKPLSRYREVSTVVFQGIVSLATLLAL